MNEARILFDAATLHADSVGPATANICISMGDVAFPAKDWNDFAVVILEAWVSALLRILNGVSRQELIYFMEGPHSVEVSLLPARALRLRAISNQDIERASMDANALPLVESLVYAAQEAVSACQSENCWSTDAQRLSSNLPELRRGALKLRN